MKKLKFLGIATLSFAFLVCEPKALVSNGDGTYTNRKGAIISSEQYEYFSSRNGNGIMDILPQEQLDDLYFTDSYKPTEKYFVTTDKIDRYGKIVESNTVETTEEIAKAVSNNDNLHVLRDGKLHDISREQSLSTFGTVDHWNYSTASKSIKLNYTPVDRGYGKYYQTSIELVWLKTPIVKSFDVLAVRWNTSKPTSNITGYTALQLSDAGTTEYDINSKNLKISTSGVGQSMNLYDAGTTFSLAMLFNTNEHMGEYMYGTYQHAINQGVVLQQSLSYNFSSSGFGGVLGFYNGVGQYYDNMNGVVDTLSSGSHFPLD